MSSKEDRVLKTHISVVGKESSPTESSQVEALKDRFLYQDVCRAAQHLDHFLLKGNAHKELFKPHVLALRDMVQQICIKLMFLHQWIMGRKQKRGSGGKRALMWLFCC